MKAHPLKLTIAFVPVPRRGSSGMYHIPDQPLDQRVFTQFSRAELAEIERARKAVLPQSKHGMSEAGFIAEAAVKAARTINAREARYERQPAGKSVRPRKPVPPSRKPHLARV